MEFIWQRKFKPKSKVTQWTMFNKISVTPGVFIICLVFWKCFLYKCLSQLSSEIWSFSPWVSCLLTVWDLSALAVPLASKVWSLLQAAWMTSRSHPATSHGNSHVLSLHFGRAKSWYLWAFGQWSDSGLLPCGVGLHTGILTYRAGFYCLASGVSCHLRCPTASAAATQTGKCDAI